MVRHGGKHGVRTVWPQAERLLTLQIAMKCADMGHMAESLEVHKKWVASLEEEVSVLGSRASWGRV